MVNKEIGGLVKWDPGSTELPHVDFLFLTSAKRKAQGLAELWGSKAWFGNWSPANPPEESNHKTLDQLIRDKARDLTKVAVEELTAVHALTGKQLPKRYLVTDTHPSLSRPGHKGEVHLLKPDKDLSLDGIVKFMADTWTRFDGPVDVQLASAFAMTDKEGKIITNLPMQDSVFIKYPENPLGDEESIRGYLSYLRKERFPGLNEKQFVSGISGIAGATINEFLYLYAWSRGIEGTITHALSCPNEPSIDSILGMGAAGLTPALVGWIEQKAKAKI